MSTLVERRASLSDAARRALREAADGFEMAWAARAEPPEIDEFVDPAGPARPLTLLELVKIDIDRRRANLPELDSWFARYPELRDGAELEAEVIAWDFHARSETGSARIDVYLCRFPALASWLRPRLNQLAGPFHAPPGYEDLQYLARGGMGEVYAARESQTGRAVAIKVLCPESAGGAEALSRFDNEFISLAGLSSEAIVRLYHFGEHQGRRYAVMEFCPGGSMADLLKDGRSLPPRRAASLAAAAAEGVATAHAAGVIHRDIKPANILLDAAGKPKVADFGLAKRADADYLTRTGTVLGTAPYMPPEQARGVTAVDEAVDVYALGATLYHGLVGSPPLTGGAEWVDPRPPRAVNPELPLDLEAVVLKCLERSPSRRYASAGELRDDLRRYLAGEPISARPPSAARRAWRGVRRRPGLTVAALALLLLPTAVAAVAVHYSFRLQKETDAANQARATADAARGRALDAADALVGGVVDGIEPIAGTRVRRVRDILARAERLYREGVAADPSPRARAGLGRLHTRFAAVYRRMNDTDAARKSAGLAVTTFERLMNDDPGGEYRLDLADAEYRRGEVELVSSTMGDALKRFVRCRDLRKAAGGDATDLVKAYCQCGKALQALGQIPSAKAEYGAALAAARGEGETALGRRLAAMAHERLGNLALEDSQLDPAETHYMRAKELFDSLRASDRWDATLQQEWAFVMTGIGRTKLERSLRRSSDESNDALKWLKLSRDAAAEGLRHDPDDVKWQEQSFLARNMLAVQERFQGASTPAGRVSMLKNAEGLRGLMDSVTKRDPHNRVYQVHRADADTFTAMCHFVIAMTARNREDADQAALSRRHVRLAKEFITLSIRRRVRLVKLDPAVREWKTGLEHAKNLQAQIVTQFPDQPPA